MNSTWLHACGNAGSTQWTPGILTTALGRVYKCFPGRRVVRQGQHRSIPSNTVTAYSESCGADGVRDEVYLLTEGQERRIETARRNGLGLGMIDWKLTVKCDSP